MEFNNKSRIYVRASAGQTPRIVSDPAPPDPASGGNSNAVVFTGDNADAIYFDAPVSADHVYTVRGNMDGAVYVSITLEVGTADGSLGSQKYPNLVFDRLQSRWYKQ